MGEPGSWEWPVALVRVSFQDVLFALSLGAIAEFAVWLASGRPRINRALRHAIVACCALCALYGVVAYGIFESFGRPLSYDLLLLMRNAAAAKSSITDRLTWPVVAALICAPGGFLAAALWGSRGRTFPPYVMACMGSWIALGAWQHAKLLPDKKALRLALSPHVELLRSTFGGLTKKHTVSLPQDYPPEDVAEFQLYGARKGEERTGFLPQDNARRPKNVIVIVMESVGTRYLSLYGSRYDTTPNLVAESSNALVFDQMYAHAPYTFCTFMAVNFSIYPGLPWCYAPAEVFEPHGPRHLPSTLASVLGQKGWRTAYLHNGDLDWGGESVMLDGAGYETVQDYHQFGCPQLTSWGAEDRFLFDRLIDWIKQKPGQPFLAYCWTDQTHNPYAQKPGTKRIDFFHGDPPKSHPEALSRYLNVLHETDGHLERLFAELRQLGLADDTLVVVTGDHGEAFADPHEQQGHGFTVYEEEVHVPFMIWNPRLFHGGPRMNQIGGHVDMNPTIADILGIEIPDEWQGHSLFASHRPERTFFVASVDEYHFGTRDGQWKYIYEATKGSETLYDLESDPSEQRNVIYEQPEKAHRLRQHLAAWMWYEDTFLGGKGGGAAAGKW